MTTLESRFLTFILIIIINSSCKPDFTNNNNATEYCKLCENGKHTMCKYTEYPSSTCIEHTFVRLSPTIKANIVELHNEIRNYVAMGEELRGRPGPQHQATNMKLINWNDELAMIAQRWAAQCTFAITTNNKHDECRKTKDFEVGQNIYYEKLNGTTPLLDVREVILQWYEATVSTMDNALILNYKPHTGDNSYTQLVWAKTFYVGCGYSSYKEKHFGVGGEEFIHAIVCNYAPAGNVLGQPVYNVGPSGSDCLEKDQQYHALCKGLTLEEAFHNMKIQPPGKHPSNNGYDDDDTNKRSRVRHVTIDAGGNVSFENVVILNLTGKWSGGFCKCQRLNVLMNKSPSLERSNNTKVLITVLIILATVLIDVFYTLMEYFDSRQKRQFNHNFRDHFKFEEQQQTLLKLPVTEREQKIVEVITTKKFIPHNLGRINSVHSYFNQWCNVSEKQRKKIAEKEFNMIKIVDESLNVLISIDRNSLYKYKGRCVQYYGEEKCTDVLFVVKSMINLWKNGRTKEHMTEGDTCFCYHKVLISSAHRISEAKIQFKIKVLFMVVITTIIIITK